MSHTISPIRLLTTLVVGLMLALTQLVGPASTVSAPFENMTNYTPKAVTDTELSLDRNVMCRYSRNVAHVDVSSGVGTPKGQVTISVAGQSVTKWLRDGSTSWVLPRGLPRGTYKVRAHYHGNDRYRGSNDSESLTVKRCRGGEVQGEEGFGDGDKAGGDNAGNDGANRPGTVAGVDAAAGGGTSADGLGDTGASGSTTLLALLGVGLLGLGGLVMLTRRRARG